MKVQSKMILNDPEVQRILLELFESTENGSDKDAIENITDGEVYTKLSTAQNPLSSELNFSYTLNAAGCQSFESSKFTTWPIYGVINELPPKLQRKHMIMPSICVNNEEPNMQLFLKPFVDQANDSSEKSIEWTLDDEIVKSRFIETRLKIISRKCIQMC
ncbi:uncharacterized protein LOC125500983 [Athalia rosae]|uniref:uncharacterized protein LOC125500983 n=1 Tax=Athalia rosae TaxID=37344 RepID=UPI0020332A3A|nr:uncharacterized protein LOC125500983 [Athalia rosae]